MTWFSKSYTLGLIFIVAVAVIWAGASVLIQHIYQDMDFKSPFLLTYLANSLLVLYLPLWQLWIALGLVKPDTTGSISSISGNSSRSSSELIVSQLHEDVFSDTVSVDDNMIGSDLDPVIPRQQPEFTHWDILKIAAIICPLWFLSNCMYNYSLLMTSVSSSTIISNLAGSFTLFFSWYMGLEVVTYGKVFGIVTCFLGAVCIGLSDTESSGDHSVAGDAVALLAALGYGLYTTVIRYKITDDESVSMQLLLGYIGLLNAIFLAPALPILYYLGLDDLTSLTGAVVGFMILNGLCNTVLSDYLWARAVVLTSPTVATIGVTITIPLALISDFLLHGASPTALSGTGAFLVLCGFTLVNITQEMELDIRKYFGCDHEYARVSLSQPKNDDLRI